MDIDTALNDKDPDAQLATGLLRDDHAVIRALFEQYHDARDEDAENRQVLAQAICMQMELHSRIELEVLYPGVREHDGDALIADAIENHKEIAAAIAELRELPADSDDYDELIAELHDLAEDHFAEEETALFPDLEERIPAALAGMTEDIIAFKERLVGSTDDLESRS